MIIYKITCKLNGMIYVGQTTRSLDERIKEHRKKSVIVYSNSYIDRAIQKNGWENFSVEIIETCETLEQLNEREIFWIHELNCKKTHGYNLTDGGEGSTVISSQMKHEKNYPSRTKASLPNLVAKRRKLKFLRQTKVTKYQTKQKHKCPHHIKVKNLAKRPAQEWRLLKKNKRPVRCVETRKIFESIASAAKWAGVAACTITSVLKNRTVTAGGYHWKYAD